MVAKTLDVATIRHPGWREIAIAVTIYVVGTVALGLWMTQVVSDRPVFRVNVAGAVNFSIGAAGLLAAYALRVRDWRAFGFQPSAGRWLLVAVGVAIAAFFLIFLVEEVYFHFITEPNTQGDFQAAARGGILSALLLLFTGGVLGPIGEELVFRGVVASALNRYGAWVGILGSAAIFAVIHGPSVIMVDAFVVGILLGLVYRRSGSIWPPIVLHIVYNSVTLSYYAVT